MVVAKKKKKKYRRPFKMSAVSTTLRIEIKKGGQIFIPIIKPMEKSERFRVNLFLKIWQREKWGKERKKPYKKSKIDKQI